MIKRTDTLLDAIRTFADYSMKRLVVGEENDVYSILTHSYIIEFMQPYVEHFKFSKIKIGDLLDQFDDPITISENCTLKAAFQKMQSHRSSGLAVIDNNGHILGNISQSDLKVIGTEGENINNLFVKLNEVRSFKQVISVGLGTTVGEAFKMLLENSIHRLYIVENNRAIKVITYLNLIKLMYNEIKESLL